MIEHAELMITPIVSGFIGYITNAVAIKMLFRPHTEKHIFGVQVPFTPGLIPKEKGRIAEALGDVISNNFMNQEYLNKYLLSDDMLHKLRSSVTEFIDTQKKNEETVSEFLAHYLSKEEIATITTTTNANLTKQISEKLSEDSVGQSVARIAMASVEDKLRGDSVQSILGGLNGNLANLGRMASFLAKPLIEKIVELLREPTEKFLAHNINDMLKKNGGTIVSNMVNGEVDSFFNKKVCHLLAGHEDKLNKAVNTVENIYLTIIENHLPEILKSIDVKKIICERINEMDVKETEELIFKVMDKELKAITWLGALLGFLMGFITIGINHWLG